MKKTIIVMAVAAIVSISASAQPQHMSREEMQSHRAERIQQQADKLAKDFELKGDEKDQFVSLYTDYQKALQEAQARPRNKSVKPENQKGDKKEKGDKKDQKGEKKVKELTDEEATQKIEELLTRQAEQIAQSQKRLEVNREYYAKFKQVLKPQQILKVLNQQQQQGQMRMGGQPGGRGGFGGPQGGGRPGGFGGPQGGGFGGDF